MTVRKLIEALQALTEEEKEFEVLTNTSTVAGGIKVERTEGTPPALGWVYLIPEKKL